MKKLFPLLLLLFTALPALYSCGEETIPVSAVELNKTSLVMMVGDETTLTATVKPADATEKTVSWRSTDETIVSVNNGRLKALKPGNATITAIAGGKAESCMVKVEQRTVAVSSVELDQKTLEMTEGDEVTLTATVKPDDATDKTVTWSTSDAAVATVTGGKVKALKPGNVTITATAGGKSAQCAVTVQAKVIPVTSVELNKTALEMTEGDETTLTATVKPDDATDKTVTWTTSDAAVATVADGKVKALKAGSVTITATAGEKSAACAITVKAKVVPVTSVTLDKTTVTLTEGDETTLTATVKPDNATDKTVTWTSSDATVATVTDGKVKALKAGTATITAKAGDKTATCAVTVKAKVIPVTSMWLDKSELELTEGDEAVLTATVMPENATDKTVTWTSSNTSVATVTNGKVKAVKAGTATITAKAGDKSAKCTVTVLPSFIAVTSVTLDKTTLGLVEGGQAVLTATVSPDNATDPTVTWTSSNTSVATVEDGMVTAVKAGTATITAKAGDKTAKCTVTVTAAFVPVTSVTLNKTTLEMTEGDETTLTATVKPDNATDKTVTWTTSDASVATVTDGKVKALKAGSVTITATAGEKSATCAITVKAKVIPVTSVTLDKTTLSLVEGDDATLVATVKPDNAIDKTVTWTSSDASVATVTDGQVHAVKVGTAVITAKAGDKTATCTVTVATKVIPVTSIWLDKSEMELTEGDEAVLTATVKPDDATDKTVTWTSSDPSVATVTDGKVKALKPGTATITAKAGDKSAKCTVTVKELVIPVTSITLNKSNLSMMVGDEFLLVATVLPENATDKTVTWISRNETVVTVTDGLVKALKAGSTIIIAQAGDESVAIPVYVEERFIPVTSVTLDKHTLEMTVGDEYALHATILPEDATNKNIDWISSSEYFATVEDGLVKALKPGEVTITAQVADKEDRCVITIKEATIPVTSVALDAVEMTLIVGKNATLTATVKPDNATDKTVTWTTSNAKVATVTDGVVTAVATGTATITAKAGDKTATCAVTVVNKPVINLPVTSMETGGRVDMPGSLSYSITNPLPGETLQAYSNVNWIRITEITETEVKFKTERASTTDRTGTIFLDYPDADQKSFTVNQHNFNYDWTTITVTPTSVSAPASGQTYTVSYTIQNPVEGYPVFARTYPSNCEWITSISVNPTSSSAGTATFTVKANTTTQAREAKFRLQSEAFATNAIVSVSQAGQPAGPPDIDMGGRDLNATYGLYPGGEEECFYARVVNPVEGTQLKISADVSWMTKFRDEGDNHYFTATANRTGATRYGNVTVTYGSISKTIKYVQEAAPLDIVLTPNNATFDYHPRSVSFEVSLPDGADYNQLNVTTDYTRIIRNLTRNGNKVTFDLRENNDGYDRTAEIEVSMGSVKATFHLTQTYAAPVFHVYPSTSVTVGYAEADHPIDVQVENPREQIQLSLLNLDAPGWITCRTVNGVPTFHVYENKTGKSRSSRVQISYGGNTDLGYVNVTVTQTTASTAINVTPAKIECDAAGTTQTLTFSITDPLSGVEMTATPGSPWILVNSVSNTSAKVTVMKNLANKSRSSSITFYYGSYSVVVPVTQQASSTPAGFVDLGLPSGTLWAEANVGAASDYEAGSFFAWAEKTPKTTFGWNNYLWGTASNLTKYNATDKKTLVELADDAAYQANASWTLPTKAQFEELINYCDREWVDSAPYYGMRFKSKVGDTSIFLPAAGFIQTWADGEWAGYYWSKSLYTGDRKKAYYLIFMESADLVQTEERFVGMTIRAVKK